MQAWRIVKSNHESMAFSGEGAFPYGGRWNSPGTRIVYVGGSLSLAALELLVHLPSSAPVRFSTFRITFDGSLVETLKEATLPNDWQAEPPEFQTQEIGDDWVRGGGSAILAVPSAIIPEETNYLLNPGHPDFSKIKIDAPKPFAFDPRLIGK